MTELTLFNSLTRQLEPFRPVHEGEARVYSCGPTVYNYPHIGNMRAYVFADLLGRTLSWRGYRLTHVINITDVGHLTDDADGGEDKMERMAAQRVQSIWDIARHYTEAYFADIRALNIRQPAHWSVATDYIEAMVEFAGSIEERHCYRLESGLYFDVSTVADYGLLARAQTDEGESRIEAVAGKRNAADFAIWRTTPAGERRQMEWDSPWGRGAPGWHLECSVMSGKLLGFPFDIHTGGIDHREIHHPNEIAQNQAFCGCGSLADPAHSGARMWLHNNFLVQRGGKMSKSSGEFLRVPLLVERGYHPLAYRMLCLQAHYRSELEFSWDALGAGLTRLKRLVMTLTALRERAPDAGWAAWTREGALAQDWGPLQPSMERFDAALADDLATPIALTALEDVLAAKKVDPALKLAAAAAMDSVLGLDLGTLTRSDLRVRPAAAVIDDAEIATLLDRRRLARAEKDFATSDALRDELAGAGVEVMDGDPLGWEWRL
jgi:cysteinyl-tRNA synthetase